MEDFKISTGTFSYSYILYEGNVSQVNFLRINFNLYLALAKCRYKYAFAKPFINKD